jgi:hypothetical protein
MRRDNRVGVEEKIESSFKTAQSQVVGVGIAAVCLALYQMDLRELVAYHGSTIIIGTIVHDDGLEGELAFARMDRSEAIAQ